MSTTAILFLLAFFLGCGLALARHPIFGLLTYVGVFYMHPYSWWWGAALPDLRWSLLAAAVTLVALLVHKTQPKTIPIWRHGFVVWFAVFVLWIAVQSFWAKDLPSHQFLLGLYLKYLLLIGLIYACIDSERHLKWFLWMHVLGCFVLGWDVYTRYLGGRYEGISAPGLNEANAGALQMVTGLCAGAGLLLAGRLRERVALVGMMPFIVNALVTTISRSGFLAAGVAGVVFNLLSPKRHRKLVAGLSILGVVLFVMLSNPLYWSRIGTLMFAGADVEGVDTGAGRLVLIEAQWRMFKNHPLGCGHRCTEYLASSYLESKHLSAEGGRSSHSTTMTMLVEHGIPGALMYFGLVAWCILKLWRLRRSVGSDDLFVSATVPAVGAVLLSIFVGDLFVDYVKFEARFWFLAILLVLLDRVAQRAQPAQT